MEVKVVDGKNHYTLNTTLTSSCRFKFADIYDVNADYNFFEFSYKNRELIKTTKVSIKAIKGLFTVKNKNENT